MAVACARSAQRLRNATRGLSSRLRGLLLRDAARGRTGGVVCARRRGWPASLAASHRVAVPLVLPGWRLVPGWHGGIAAHQTRAALRRAAARARPPGRATLLPLPRPRHKPLKERAVYQALAMAAARTTFATTGVGGEAPPPPPAPTVQPVAAEVPAATALETERKRGGREMEEGRARRDRDRIVEEEEEGAREAAPKVHTFVLAYTLLIALTAFGLAIAGGATNYWVSVRPARAARRAAPAGSHAQQTASCCVQPSCHLAILLLS